MTFGEWEPVRDIFILAPTPAPALTLSLFQEAATPDAETDKPKRIIERKNIHGLLIY